MNRVIYMDHHATTPVDARVLEAMLPYFSERFGNAGSRQHAYGWEAEEAVDRARGQAASLVGARAKEIIFTSGATESDNLAIEGVVRFCEGMLPHIVTVVTEHKAVLDTCRFLEKEGRAAVTYLPVDTYGLVDPDDVRRAIRDDTVLVSVMFANNEIGTIHPIAEIGRLTREREVLFHCDATQGVGKRPVDVEALNIDLMSFTAHKMYGPKGCGVLYVRARAPRVRLLPLLHGGGQERGMRSGTLNVPGIVGVGAACEICAGEMETENPRLAVLRDRLQVGLFDQLDGLTLNGHPTRRLAGNLNVSIAHVESESLLLGLNEDIAVSSGSACSSATLEPSYVLRALGVKDELAHNSIRFGLGRANTEAEVETVIGRVVEEVRRLRELSPRYRAGRPAAGTGTAGKEIKDGHHVV